jgi:hypothetical protein
MQSRATTSGANFSIARWHAFAPQVGREEDWRAWLRDPSDGDGTRAKPDVSWLAPMLKRRLDYRGRMALAAAGPCVEGVGSVEAVFGSRHGALNRTVKMLEDLARGEAVSPSAFSMAVHNGVAGLFSIARGDRGAATALAAGEDTLGVCLLEGAQMIACGADNVLVVYAEDAVPDVYRELVDVPATHPFAVALLLRAEARTRCILAPTVVEPRELPEAALIRFLIGDGNDAVIGVHQRFWLGRQCVN